jgi:hypothetical protein
MTYTDVQIAQVIHGMNCALQDIQGDPSPSAPWAATIPEIKRNVAEGVAGARRGETPRQSHEAWCQRLLDAGWRYGPVKNEHERTHPCLVSYDELPPGQRLKNDLFLAVVTAFVTSG